MIEPPNETPTEPPRDKGTRLKNSGQFVKGDPRVSRGGAPKRAINGRSLTSMAREHTEKGLMKLLEIIDSPDTSNKDMIAAVSLLWNRGWGNAHQQIMIDGQMQHSHESSINPALLSVAVREALLAARVDASAPNTITVEPVLIEASPISERDDES